MKNPINRAIVHGQILESEAKLKEAREFFRHWKRLKNALPREKKPYAELSAFVDCI